MFGLEAFLNSGDEAIFRHELLKSLCDDTKEDFPDRICKSDRPELRRIIQVRGLRKQLDGRSCPTQRDIVRLPDFTKKLHQKRHEARTTLVWDVEDPQGLVRLHSS